ncbi:MAG: hypothetical protein PHD43_00540 [Methylococcales bacterium]|nr:hypothetical protein [Methylococcales bacterium]
MAASPGINAVIAAGLTIITIVAGYIVGQEIYQRTSTIQVNMVYGYEENTGVLKLGFACLCELTNPSTRTSSWKGDGGGCGISDGNALTFASDWIPANKRRPDIPPPDGACCKLQPKVGNWEAPLPNKSNCWVSGL